MRGKDFSIAEVVTENKNFLLMFGCRPSDGVALNTVMVQDIVKSFLNRFDRNTLTVAIPSVFEQLKGKDVSFEMITSNTIQ